MDRENQGNFDTLKSKWTLSLFACSMLSMENLTPKNELSVKYSSEGILNSLEKQLELAKKLRNVYDNRPQPKNFEGVNSSSKYIDYSNESILSDEKYVESTKDAINKKNNEKGQLAFIEGGFALSEMMQAMIVDRINNGMFPKFKAIMTSEFDDLKVGIDAVLKRDEGKYLGAAFDFTVSNSVETIEKKLEREWEKHIERHSIPTVKYFEDPDTHKRGSLMVPKFIIGGTKKEIEEFAAVYLQGKENDLNNHPFKYLMVKQIDEQLKSALSFFEKNKNDPSFDFIKNQYMKIALFIDELKEEIKYSEYIKTKDFFDYKKSSIAYKTMHDFYSKKDEE